jgi:hypothetical protein
MLRKLAWLSVLIAALAAAGCASRKFVVYKEGASFHVTGDTERRKKLLCDSGDIDRVLADSGLPAAMQAEFRDCICGPAGQRQRLAGILAGMTDGQYAALKEAFVKNGYEINKVADS